MTIDLRSDLFDGPDWSPGTYRVSHVVTGLWVYREDDPAIGRVLSEWESNVVEFTIQDDGPPPPPRP